MASFNVKEELAGQTLAAVLRQCMPGLSWAQAKRLIVTRRVEINGAPCLNDARRLNAGEVVTALDEPGAPVARQQNIRLFHIDADLIVVDKPPGVVTVRRHEEADFTDERKDLQPALEELVQRMLPGSAAPQRSRGRQRGKASAIQLYAVHRLDRDTSGVMLFALSPRARDALIDLFSRHEVRRTYMAVVLGNLSAPKTITSHLIRDRGDGLRGSSPLGADAPDAQIAITHVRPVEHIGDRYTVVECRLETGRTHQIRIHLAEAGHMLCGEKLYLRPTATADPIPDPSNAPRQALHSKDLRLKHPLTGQDLHFESPLPPDLARWLEKLRQGNPA